jgi:hypothetical protein
MDRRRRWILRHLLSSGSTLAQVRALQIFDNSLRDLSNEGWVERIWWLRLAEGLVDSIADRLRLRVVEGRLIDGAGARS